ncbi:hypothetical protein MUP00_00195, partial [Candidatus Bathyarchaeota archaeon]|nr:hypothetical protein [Candidatus Bathyarchaeota archaeon]
LSSQGASHTPSPEVDHAWREPARGAAQVGDWGIKNPPDVGPDVWATSRYGETVLERLSSAESPRRVPDTC